MLLPANLQTRESLTDPVHLAAKSPIHTPFLHFTRDYSPSGGPGSTSSTNKNASFRSYSWKARSVWKARSGWKSSNSDERKVIVVGKWNHKIELVWSGGIH
jgi:hypothetical protein